MSARGWKLATVGLAAFFAPAVGIKVMLAFWRVDVATEAGGYALVFISLLLGAMAAGAAVGMANELLPKDGSE